MKHQKKNYFKNKFHKSTRFWKISKHWKPNLHQKENMYTKLAFGPICRVFIIAHSNICRHEDKFKLVKRSLNATCMHHNLMNISKFKNQMVLHTAEILIIKPHEWMASENRELLRLRFKPKVFSFVKGMSTRWFQYMINIIDTFTWGRSFSSVIDVTHFSTIQGWRFHHIQLKWVHLIKTSKHSVQLSNTT